MTNIRSELVRFILSQGVVGLFIELIILAGSVLSWSIIFYKVRFFRRVRESDQRFLSLFRKSEDWAELKGVMKRFEAGSLVPLFKAGCDRFFLYTGPGEVDAINGDHTARMASIERALKGASQDQVCRVEEYLSFLAVVTNISPLLGLLGTVWGVMDVFIDMGRQGAVNIATVGPGVATALVTTIAGIIAAVPAAAGFNFFMNKIRVIETQMEIFVNEFLSLAEERIVRERSLELRK